MTRAQPAGDIKVQVPRHNTQPISKKLCAEVEAIAKSDRVQTDIHPSQSPTHELAQAIESASDWNSLLMTARAERGPQWDVGTQQFQVDEDSELYYDPALLLEAQKQEDEASRPTQSDFQDMSPTAHRGYHHSTSGYPYGVINSPTMQRNYVGGPFTAVAPNQFYAGAQMESPVRMGMNHDVTGMGMGMSPGMGRRVTRGMMDDFM